MGERPDRGVRAERWRARGHAAGLGHPDRRRHDAWEQDRGTEWDRGVFAVDVAPDWLHKANVSGAGPYAIEVPNKGVDALLLAEPHLTTFVNYLRIAFQWGGFPGWERGLRDGWAQPSIPPPELISELRGRLISL